LKLGLALCAMLAPLSAGCSAAVPLVTVDTLLAQCDAFKGKRVQLAGYLGQCAGYECDLAVDKAHWAAFVSAFNNAHAHQSEAKRAEAWSRVRPSCRWRRASPTASSRRWSRPRR